MYCLLDEVLPGMRSCRGTSLWLLPLPALRLGSLRMTLPILDVRSRGVEYLERPVSGVLNPPEATGMGFWSLNPYVGCEFGCAYCYARFAHRYGVERADAAGVLPGDTRSRIGRLPHPWEAFERAIFVKRRSDFESALMRDLRRVLRRTSSGTQHIAIGTATDAYQPAERRFGLTRRALELLLTARGLRISIVTKSPLVTRDADILRVLNERNEVAVHLSLITLDAALIRTLEPRSPLPHARLRAVRRLADAGVPVGIFCAPVLPGLTDDVPTLRSLFRAARQVGASFAPGCALRLYDEAKPPLVAALEQRHPEVAAVYRDRYARAREAPGRYRDGLSRRMRRLRNEAGLKPAAFNDFADITDVQLAFSLPR
jgi:DNA repair photolyase